MAHQYAKIAFTQSVRQVQTEHNSRSGYAGMDSGEDYNFMLSQEESNFIQQRDSFYMASVGETDWPYVQHRGGPKGFLKVIDATTLGFSDYSGNRQYISTGNFRTNDKVSLFLMDYANRRRLKIMGYISQVDADDWETQVALEDDQYRARVERAFVIKIAAFDWNCPQHITPRYTEAEISALISPLQEQIKNLQAQTSSQPNQAVDVIGDGELALTISGIQQLTPHIRSYKLQSPSGDPLPLITAGAHIQVPIASPNGKTLWRSYSILNADNAHSNTYYEIAVKCIDEGDGGSKALHQQYQLGLALQCKTPQNLFALNPNATSSHTVLIAGGIGITPIKSMAMTLLKQAQSFELHYAARSKSEMIYVDQLSQLLGDRLHLYPSDVGDRLSVDELLASQISRQTDLKEAPTQFYLCGPNGMLTSFIESAKTLAISDEQIHYEQFSASPSLSASAKPFQLTLTKSNRTIAVASDQSLLDALLNEGVDVPYSCKSGLCKSCVVKVSPQADIEHLDSCLSETERASGKMCLCVSRPRDGDLYIEL